MISPSDKNGFKVVEVEASEDIGVIICHIKPENSDNVLVTNYVPINN